MKKEYKAPTVLVVNVKIESLLETLSVNGTTNSGSADSRQSSSWDDED